MLEKIRERNDREHPGENAIILLDGDPNSERNKALAEALEDKGYEAGDILVVWKGDLYSKDGTLVAHGRYFLPDDAKNDLVLAQGVWGHVLRDFTGRLVYGDPLVAKAPKRSESDPEKGTSDNPRNPTGGVYIDIKSARSERGGSDVKKRILESQPEGDPLEWHIELPSEVHSTGSAVSLKVLQERVKDCMAKGNCAEDLLHLCGIKRFVGYVIDVANRDIILIGKIDSTSPPLELEDFVIALRNAWWIYAPLRGNTYYYSPPHCDIRPDARILRELGQVHAKISISSSEEDVQQSLNQWREVCGQPQRVTVGGIPPQSRFGSVMVEADYYMKKLVDGSDTLNVDGFKSLTDMALEIIQRDIMKGKPISVPMNPMNRFEFYPGKRTLYEDEGVVSIKNCEVTLLTEEQFLSKTGEMAGTGRADSLAERFAKNFTTRYEQIAKQKSIYAELEGLFRFVMLAHAMKLKDAVSLARIGLDYLLKEYPIKECFVDTVLAGVSNVKELKHRNETQDGYEEYYLWLPSCGGVRIDMRITEKDFMRSKPEQFRGLKRSVLEARPALDALTWFFPAIWIAE